jgi:hypothetical protein
MASSIASKLSANYTINLIRLSLNSPTGQDKVWVLVEGEDDCKIYPKFFRQNKCNVEQVHGGYSQLEISIETLQQFKNQIIGVRDADFCHLSEKDSLYENLFYTDCHDIEMTMIQNHTVFKNILYEYALQAEDINIKQNILEEASFVGYVRYYNDNNSCSINFEGISFGDITINQNNKLLLQKTGCIQKLNERSPHKTSTIDESVINTFTTLNPVEDLFQLVNGHDFIKLLSCRINFRIEKKSISHKDVAKSLRNTYRINDFEETQLYKKLAHWQTTFGHDILATETP